MKRWMYVILGLLINVCLGTVYSWSVFRKPLEAAIDLSPTQSGLPYMIFLAVFAFSMPLGGFLLQKLGPKLAVILGGVLVGGGWVASSFANSITSLVLSYGFVAGIGVGLTYGVPLAVAAKWFPDKKGLALGLTLAGFGLSPFITAPLATYLIETYTVMPTFKILGISFLVTIILLSLFLRFPKDEEVKMLTPGSTAKTDSQQFTTKEMLGTSQFYGLWVCYIIGTLAGLTAIGITSNFGQEVAGISAVTAAFAASIFGIFNGIGRPIFGSITDKFGPKKSAMISFTMIIIASIIALFAKSSPILFYVSFAIIWMNLGGWLAIAPAGTSSYFGLKNYAKNYGIMFTAYGVGAIVGMLTSGKLKEAFESYTFTFYPVIVLCVLGIIIAWVTLKKPQKA